MPGGRARPSQQPRSPSAPDSPPVAADWYVVTGDGTSALRIVPRLAVGESESGALALNDPDPGNQWIEFDLGDHGEPSVAVITRDKSLVVDGINRMRQRLCAGATLKLPRNTLYISRNSSLPAPSGPVLEVVPREVPDRPQDLVAPGWEEALEAVRRVDARLPADADSPVDADTPADAGHGVPAAASGNMDAGAPGDEVGPGSGGGPAVDWEAELDTVDATAADPSPDRRPMTAGPAPRRTRHRRKSSWNNLVLAAAFGVMVVAGAVALLAGTWLDGSEVTTGDAEPGVATEASGPPADGEPSPAAGAADSSAEAAGRDGSVAADGAVESGRTAADGGSAEAVRPAADGEAGLPSSGQAPPEEVVAPLREGEAAGGEPVADLDWRLIRARELMDAGYITYPPEDNAVAYLERLLATDPDHPRAMAMLDEATRELIDAAVRAHDQGLDFQARNTLEEVFGFNPDSQRAHRLWREWVGTERDTPAAE